MASVIVGDSFPVPIRSGLNGDLHLADSGLHLNWLLATLSQNCPEYGDALGRGSVKEVSDEVEVNDALMSL